MSGQKKFIHANNAKHLAVPQYESLYLKDILAKVGANTDLQRDMPIAKELSKCPKAWIINVAYTLIIDQFSDWIMEQVEARNRKVAVHKDLIFNIHPAEAAAWQSSSAVSCK